MRLAQLEKLALSGFSHRPGQIRVTPQPCLAHKSQRQFGANLTPIWCQRFLAQIYLLSRVHLYG